MKRFLLLFTVLLSGLCLSQNSVKYFNVKPINEIPKETLKGYNVKFDKFEKIHIIQAKSPYTNDFYPLLIINENGECYIKLIVNYMGKNWIFFNEVQLLIKNEKFSFNVSGADKKVSGGFVYENSYTLINEDVFEILKEISAAGEKIDLRLIGEGIYDGSIGVNEAKITTKILDLLDKIKID